MEVANEISMREEQIELNLMESQSTMAGTGISILQTRRLTASQVPLCSMCETMDLVATSEGPKGKVVIRRFMDWQTVQDLSLTEGGDVGALSWSPDGYSVALGTSSFVLDSYPPSHLRNNPFDNFHHFFSRKLHHRLVPREGDVQVLLVEGGRQLGWEELVGLHGIVCMKWSSQIQQEINAPDLRLGGAKSTVYDPSLSFSNMKGGWQRLLGDIECSSGSLTVDNKEPLTKDASAGSFEQMRKGPLTLLACADKKGSVRIYAFGLFCLLSTQLPQGSPLSLELSPDLSALGAISGGGETGEPITLSIARIPELWTARHYLVAFSSCRASLGLLIKDMHLSLMTISSSWLEATSPLGTKLRLLSKMLQDYGISDSCPRDEFTNLVTCGYASPPLHQFLLQSFTKGHITLLRKATDNATRCAEAEIRDGLGGYARQTLAVIGELRGLALMPGAEKWFGREDCCVNLLKLAQIVCYGVEGLVHEVQTFRSRLCLFLDYLQQWHEAVVEGTTTTETSKSTGSDNASPSLGVMRNVLHFLLQPSILTLRERLHQQQSVLPEQQQQQPTMTTTSNDDGGSGSNCTDTPAFEAENLMWCKMGYYLGKTASHYPEVAKSRCINDNTGGDCSTTVSTDPFTGIIPDVAVDPPPLTDSLETLSKEVEAVCEHPTQHLTEQAQRAPWAYYAVVGNCANTATALHFTKSVEQKSEDGGSVPSPQLLKPATEMWTLVTAVSEGSIVWMFQINLESGGIRAAALNVCCGTPESVLPHICVKQIRFYSPLCNNTPPLRDSMEERIVLLLHSPSKGIMWLSSIVTASLDFKAINYDPQSARQSGVTSVLVDIVQTGNNFQCRSKMLIDPHPATMLEVSAGRGMACVWGGAGGYFYVMDMEGNGEEEGLDEDEEEGSEPDIELS